MYCHHVMQSLRVAAAVVRGGEGRQRRASVYESIMLRESFHPGSPSKGVLSSNSSRALSLGAVGGGLLLRVLGC